MLYLKTKDMINDLRDICYKNTKSYRTDFDKDAEIILAEAGKKECERGVLLWLSYPCGTRILRESDVFLKNSPLYTTWLYYETEENVVAAALEIHGMDEEGKVIGTICGLDYNEHCNRVRERAVSSSTVRYVFENGESVVDVVNATRKYVNDPKNKLKELYWLPDDSRQHEIVLFTEGCIRNGNSRAMEKKSVVKPVFSDKCSFGHVFDKRDEQSMRPVREVAYARSDYDGYRWWTSWFTNGPKVQGSEAEEIDGFRNSVFEMEEFKDLKSMTRFCKFAQPLSEPTEFNLFSETFSFYVWMRLITRPKDYNVYMHFYKKD